MQATIRASDLKLEQLVAEHAFELASRAEAPGRPIGQKSGGDGRSEESMDDLLLVMASNLRGRAARCREIARTARSEGIAGELLSIADEYEEDAERLETRAPRALGSKRGLAGSH